VLHQEFAFGVRDFSELQCDFQTIKFPCDPDENIFTSPLLEIVSA
jgi:hypothetical protein